MKNELITRIELLLSGIDQTETDSLNGWWETSAGAEFGSMKLAGLKELIFNDTRQIDLQYKLLHNAIAKLSADNRTLFINTYKNG